MSIMQPITTPKEPSRLKIPDAPPVYRDTPELNLARATKEVTSTLYKRQPLRDIDDKDLPPDLKDKKNFWLAEFHFAHAEKSNDPAEKEQQYLAALEAMNKVSKNYINEQAGLSLDKKDKANAIFFSSRLNRQEECRAKIDQNRALKEGNNDLAAIAERRANEASNKKVTSPLFGREFSCNEFREMEIKYRNEEIQNAHQKVKEIQTELVQSVGHPFSAAEIAEKQMDIIYHLKKTSSLNLDDKWTTELEVAEKEWNNYTSLVNEIPLFERVSQSIDRMERMVTYLESNASKDNRFKNTLKGLDNEAQKKYGVKNLRELLARRKEQLRTLKPGERVVEQRMSSKQPKNVQVGIEYLYTDLSSMERILKSNVLSHFQGKIQEQNLVSKELDNIANPSQQSTAIPVSSKPSVSLTPSLTPELMPPPTPARQSSGSQAPITERLRATTGALAEKSQAGSNVAPNIAQQAESPPLLPTAQSSAAENSVLPGGVSAEARFDPTRLKESHQRILTICSSAPIITRKDGSSVQALEILSDHKDINNLHIRMNRADGTADEMKRTVDTVNKKISISLSRKSSDESFLTFCELNRDVDPLRMNPCGNPEIVLKMLEASVIQRTKIDFSDQDKQMMAQLPDSDLKAHYTQLITKPEEFLEKTKGMKRTLGKPLETETGPTLMAAATASEKPEDDSLTVTGKKHNPRG